MMGQLVVDQPEQIVSGSTSKQPIVEFSLARINFFKNLIYTVWIAQFVYCIFYAFIDARFALSSLLGCATVLKPIVMMLERFLFRKSARLLFLLTCNLCVYLPSLGFSHQIDAEHFYLSTAILPLLLFGNESKKLTAIGILFPLIFVMMTWNLGHDFLPQNWHAGHQYAHILRQLNFLAALASVLTSVGIFLSFNSHLKKVIAVQASEKRAVLEQAYTLLKQKTESLRESQAVAKLGHWSYNPSNQKISWSEQMFALFPEDQEKGEPTYERHVKTIHPADFIEWSHAVQNCITSGVPFIVKFRIVNPENPSARLTWVEARGRSISDINGKITEIFGTCQDITENKKMETELLETKNVLQTVLDHMPGPVYARDMNGNFIFANSVFYQVVPGASPPLVGKNIFSVFPQEVAKSLQDNDNWILQSNQSHQFEEVVPQPDGTSRIYDTYKFPLVDEGGQPFAVAGISIDTTNRKKMEADLEQQTRIAHHNAKLASIGELAAGVGHEINNPLTIADGNIQRIKKLIAKHGIVDMTIDAAFEKYGMATTRIANIVQGLRTFARSDSDSFDVFDVALALEQTVSLVQEIYHKDGVTLTLTRPDKPCYVYGNIGRIQQCFMNLISNAKDALEGSSKKNIDIVVAASITTFEIRIVDTGGGVPPQLEQKIFNAFFTTKEIGKGTGIGLSLTLAIIKEHHGTIDFKSSPEGTIFRLILPRSDTEARPKHLEIVPEGRKKVASIRALVAEDEPDLRDVLCELLRDRDCIVDTACDGFEALQLLERQHFDIVLTDLKMPNMGGKTLVKKIRERPGPQPFLVAVTGGVVSGFTQDKGDEFSGLLDAYLPKPFTEIELDEILNLARNSISSPRRTGT